MDRDEQARKMLSRDPAEWSEGARKLRLPLEKLPDHVREAVAARVEQAKAGAAGDSRPASPAHRKPAAFPMGRKIAYAAAAIFVLSLGVYIMLPGLFTGGGPPTNPDFIRGRGDFTLKRDGRELRPSSGQALVQGDKLILKKNADALLKRDKLSIYLVGPAVLEVRPGGLKNTILFLDRGAMAVRTDGEKAPAAKEHPLTGHPGLHIVTRRARYTLAGTFARLTTNQKGERIAVLQGRFRVKGILAAGETEVAAGRALAVPADPGEKIPPATPLSKGDREALKQAGESMGVLRLGRTVINPAASFDSDDEILRYYGVLHRVELKDGQSYTGFASRGPDDSGSKLRVHTTLGIVVIPAANFDSMKIIRGSRP